MVAIATTLDELGCPSGLQEDLPSSTDPWADRTSLSSFIAYKDDIGVIDLVVQGAHCGGCVAKIENTFRQLEGVQSVHMNLTTMRLHIEWHVESVDASAFIPLLKSMGYSAAPYEQTQAQLQVQQRQSQLLKAMALAGFATMNIMLMSIGVWIAGVEMRPATLSLMHWLSAAIALPTVAYSGRVFFRSAWNSLRNSQTNMDVPISLALILACGLSLFETINHNPDTYFDAAVMLLFLLLIGRYLDMRLRRQTGEAAKKLIALQSRSATRILDDGSLETIVTKLVKPGDILLIPVGQSIPVDGEIIEGVSEIDCQIATGETKPEIKSPGDHVHSGTINLTTPLKIKALALEQDSFLSEIASLVAIGEQGKSRFVRIADKAAQLYVPIVHSLAALTFLGWLLLGSEFRPAALNAIAVLIITCPCALGLAVPAVQIVASGQLFKKGVLLKSGDALERLAKVNHVVFDKTGTLTTGRFELKNRAEISDADYSIAAAMAEYSRHPVAKALHNSPVDPVEIENIIERPGQGIEGNLDGEKIWFGASGDGNKRNDGYTESQLMVGKRQPVSFLFQDKIRPSAGPAIEQLKALDMDAEMLSGDKEKIAQTVAASIGLSKARGRASPKQKIERLRQLAQNQHNTLMVGDGINDAPALAHAYISASMANGSDVSRATADIILQREDLNAIPESMMVAQKADRRVKENLGFTVVYNLCAVPLAVFGLVNPLIAAVAMSGSSLIVTLNALRMRQL